MKRGMPHVVALPDEARDVLTLIPRIEGQDLVFSTTGNTAVSGFTKAKAALDRASGVSDWRLHDIRRTGVSALARMGISISSSPTSCWRISRASCAGRARVSAPRLRARTHPRAGNLGSTCGGMC